MATTKHSFRRGLALAAVVTGLAAPAASAAPIEPVGPNPGGQEQADAYAVAPNELPSSTGAGPGRRIRLGRRRNRGDRHSRARGDRRRRGGRHGTPSASQPHRRLARGSD